MIPLDSSQPSYFLPPLETIPDNDEDQPIPGTLVTEIGAMPVSEIVFGGGPISSIYGSESVLHTDMPLRTVRLALRYGIRAIDTSPYYGMSEIVLGAVLRALMHEFPRPTYKLITKCGRYGPSREDFDYSPQAVRKSVMRSLDRLGTSYLDLVFLHDVEFVASPVFPIPYCGDPVRAIEEVDGQTDWGLVRSKAAKAWGSGDETILLAIQELFKMKEEGLIRGVGISGYPLPTLLRLSTLIHSSAPFQPLDGVMSYSHYTLQNTRFERFLPHLIGYGRVKQLFNASAFSMGLLTPKPPPWHPAPPDMLNATKAALVASESWPGGLSNLALGFTMRRPNSSRDDALFKNVPTVVGFSRLDEVHEAVKVWREVTSPYPPEERLAREQRVRELYKAAGFWNWSWSSPASYAYDLQGVDTFGRRLKQKGLSS